MADLFIGNGKHRLTGLLNQQGVSVKTQILAGDVIG